MRAAKDGDEKSQTLLAPSGLDSLKSLKAKVNVLSRELATMSRERDLLLEYVLGNAEVPTGGAPTDIVRQLFSERQAPPQRGTGSLPASLGVHRVGAFFACCSGRPCACHACWRVLCSGKTSCMCMHVQIVVSDLL